MADFISFMESIPYWYWWVLAVGLMIGEIVTGTTYLLWPAIAAALVGLLDMGPMNGLWQWQLFIFGTVTILLTIFVTPMARDWLHNTKTDHAPLNERGSSLVGRRVLVVSAFENGQGKVRLDDTVWIARASSSDNFQEGDALEIEQTQGTVLIVRAVA